MIPTVTSVMTPFPYAIAAEETLRAAEAMMQTHEIRHLPVVRGGELVGVVSESVLTHALELAADLPHRQELTVEQVMSKEPYTVGLHEPLDGLLLEMASRHLGCVIVMKGDRVVGIFTSSDACRAFGDSLRRMRPGGDDAA